MVGKESAESPELSFLRLPKKTRIESEPADELEDVVLLGVPSDVGTLGRLGSAGGPEAVRRASWSAAPYHPSLGLNLFDELILRDGGDILPAVSERADSLLEAVQAEVFGLSRNNQLAGLVGGTQLLTLAALRGIAQAKRRPVALLHLSAHQSLGRGAPNEGTAIAHAQDEGLLKAERVVQVGLRGPAPDDIQSQDAFRAGFERLTVDDVRWDLHGAMETVRSYVDEASLYISLDLSVLDPSACPAVTRPNIGGLTSWEVQQLLRGLVGAEVVGFDVVGLTPRVDAADLSAMTAVAMLFELLCVVADSRNESRMSLLGGAGGRTSA